jgi:hypothetical protein
MISVTVPRSLLLLLLVPLHISAADPAAPVLQLEGLMERQQGMLELSKWGEDRLLEGIGWTIASAVRGDDDGGLKGLERRGYTVISPQRGDPMPIRHVYVLAGFDILPDQYLLVVIRDKEMFWTDYDYDAPPPQDAVELVWYDSDWNELWHKLLDFKADEYPDDFRLSEDGKYLLTITHTTKEGDPKHLAKEGHMLKSIRLKDGIIKDVPFPDQQYGVAPATWWPVLMQWNRDDDLLVQAGEDLRRYSVKSPRF